MAPHFRIPLNLPHAATIATRIQFHLDKEQAAARTIASQLVRLVAIILPTFMFLYVYNFRAMEALQAQELKAHVDAISFRVKAWLVPYFTARAQEDQARALELKAAELEIQEQDPLKKEEYRLQK